MTRTPEGEPRAPAPGPLRAGRRAFRTLAALVLAVAALAGLATAGVVGLAASEAGTAWLVGRAIAWSGAPVDVRTVEGRLADRITLGGLTVRGGAHRLRVDRVELAWAPLASLNARRLEVRRLVATGVRYRGPPPGPGSAGPPRLPDLAAAVPVRIARLEVADVTVERGDAAPLRAARVSLALDLDGDGVRVSDLVLDAPGLALAGRASLGARAPHRLTASATWEGAAPGLGPVRGRLELDGPALAPALSAELSAPFPVELRGGLDARGTEPALELDLSWREARWPLGGEARARSPSGEARVRGGLADLAVTLRADTVVPGVPVRALRLAVGGRVEPGGGPSADLRLSWEAELEGGARAAGAGPVRVGRQGVSLEQTLSAPFPVELALEGGASAAGAPRGRLRATWREARWPLAGTPRLRSESGSFAVEGEPDELRARLEAELAGAGALEHVTASVTGRVGPEAPHPLALALEWAARIRGLPALRGQGRIEGDRSALDVAHRLGSPAFPATVETRGRVDLAGGEPELALEGTWEGLRWPLASAGPTPTVEAATGRYRIEGPLPTVAATVVTELRGPDLPRIGLDARVRRVANGVILEALRAKLLGGTAEATGRLELAETTSLEARVRARGLDPGRRWKGADGRIDLEARVEGRLAGPPGAGGRRVVVALESLAGSLRERPLSGAGRVTLGAREVRIESLHLDSGDNRARVAGVVAEAGPLDLELDVRAPDLAGLWPGLAGRVAGRAEVSGDLSSPRIRADLRGSGIAAGDVRLATVRLEGTVDPADAGRSALDLELGRGRAAGIELRGLRARLRGNAARHTLELEAEGGPGSLSLTARGGIEAREWRGRLTRLEATSVRVPGTWALVDAAALRAGPAGTELGEACLGSGGARACVRGAWDASGRTWQGEAAVDGLALGPLLRPHLPPGTELRGSLSARVRGGVAPTGVEARAQAAVAEAEIRFPGPDGAAQRFPVPELSARASLAGGEGQGTLRLRLAGGELAAELRAIGLGGRPPRPEAVRLDGRVEGGLPDVAPLGALVPALAGIGGRVSVDARIGGTAAAPALSGEMALTGARALVPDAGIEVTALELRAASAGGERRLRVTGRARSGAGELRLDGWIDPRPDAGWPAELRLSGERFEALRLPTVTALASPALRIEVRAPRVVATGRVDVPEATVSLAEIPRGAVEVSADEVLVGEGGRPAPGAPTAPPAGAPGPVEIDVEVVLGDAVVFSGFGLDTRLAGRLRLRRRPGDLPLAEGALSLVEGRYRAYGQELAIERGRLVFAGPLDNPGLDLRAVRKAGAVEAGIEIGGTARAPRSRVYSKPPLPEAEALSYLLTGRPLASASRGDGAMLAQAALSLGLERPHSVVQQIGSAVGLDELSLGNAGGAQGALLLGKRLTPDLYIRYALGLLEPTATLFLNYRLTDSISLEAESGARQGVDVLYQLERETLFGGGSGAGEEKKK